MEIDPEALPIAERYRLLIGGVVPRPIALVSTISPDGRPNLAPFSFFNGVGSNPMTLLFCPANNDRGEEKDTLRNCKPADEGGTGEFVINVATEEIAVRVAAAAEPLPYGVSEFELAGLTPSPAAVVRPARVVESPISFECRTERVIRTNPGQPGGGNIVIGRVVHVAVRDGLIDAGRRIDPDLLHAIGRMGGLTYCRTRERFDLPVGRAALRAPSPTPEP